MEHRSHLEEAAQDRDGKGKETENSNVVDVLTVQE
jgi:hypothetical protein